MTPKFVTNTFRLSRAFLANLVYGFPSRKIKVIGVTGTDGKTTTCNYIYSILKHSNRKTGMMTTINFAIGNNEWVNETKMTTISTFALQKMLKRMVDAGLEYAVVEVSSHALDQNKVWGVDFDIAVITNISREHLDYHKTMEEYERAKEKLFVKLAKQHERNKEKGTRKKGISVINGEEEFTERFLRHKASEHFVYQMSSFSGTPEGVEAVKASNVQSKEKGVDFDVTFKDQKERVELKMPGTFNVYNSLAAISVALSQGLSLKDCKDGLEALKGLPGRVEVIDEGQDFTVIVDYAVTPAALTKLYGETIKKFKSQISNLKIIAVFGACGDRDRGKRPEMGKIVSSHADVCILTNEDPWSEDPMSILEMIEEGLKENKKEEGTDYFKIIDRREAIQKAFQLAKPGDIVVITGKGAEKGMQISQNKKVPWDERAIVREELAKLKK